MKAAAAARDAILHAIGSTGYLSVIFALQIIGGLLVLVGFVPLGLTILCPIIVNILLFHACMAPAGLPLADRLRASRALSRLALLGKFCRPLCSARA